MKLSDMCSKAPNTTSFQNMAWCWIVIQQNFVRSLKSLIFMKSPRMPHRHLMPLVVLQCWKRTFGKRPEDIIPKKKIPISTGTRSFVDVYHHYATQSDHDPGPQIPVISFCFSKFNCSCCLSFLGVENPTYWFRTVCRHGLIDCW